MRLRALMLGSDLLLAGALADRWDDDLTIYDSQTRRWRTWEPVGFGVIYKELRRQ